MEGINLVIGTPLGYLMWLCYYIVNNYGLAIILFTILTKVILLPLSVWVQKNSIRMIEIQPELNNIAAKYINNGERAMEEQTALYKRHNYKPIAGIVPMLIQIPIILGLIAVIYNPLQHLLHMDAEVINAFIAQGAEIMNVPVNEMGAAAQLNLLEIVNNPAYTDLFINLPVQGAAQAVADIQSIDLNFLGFDMSHAPNVASPDIYWLFPVLSGVSSYLMSLYQNNANVLQKEQGTLGKWGVAIFLICFSVFFAFIVPAGVGVYWVASNLFAIVVLMLMNKLYDPKKHIDYEALEESKKNLAESKKLEAAAKPTKEEKQRAKEDYKRFCADDNIKQLMFYSEKSGFYKYFADEIDYILRNSELTIHYVTSDPKDKILEKSDPRIVPYYIDDNHLVQLFMMVDADVVVMTTPNLQTYHLKRSMAKRNVEYIYTPHDPMCVLVGFAKGAFDHFDTVLCVGRHEVDELRKSEQVYNTREKTLVEGGYTLIDDLIKEYEKLGGVENDPQKILIAPSWQEDCILDCCINDILDGLVGKGYDITVRPHPEYVKRYPVRMQELTDAYKQYEGDNFRIETDFSSNVTIFTADLVITDWSNIAYEFSFATKKPTLFINTPMKVMNPDYKDVNPTPITLTLREMIGTSMKPDDLSNIGGVTAELLASRAQYREKIEEATNMSLFNVGRSREVCGQYIIDAVNKKKK